MLTKLTNLTDAIKLLDNYGYYVVQSDDGIGYNVMQHDPADADSDNVFMEFIDMEGVLTLATGIAIANDEEPVSDSPEDGM